MTAATLLDIITNNLDQIEFLSGKCYGLQNLDFCTSARKCRLKTNIPVFLKRCSKIAICDVKMFFTCPQNKNVYARHNC